MIPLDWSLSAKYPQPEPQLQSYEIIKQCKQCSGCGIFGMWYVLIRFWYVLMQFYVRFEVAMLSNALEKKMTKRFSIISNLAVTIAIDYSKE